MATAFAPDQTRRWTPDEVRALIREDEPSPRYELIDGELLVTASPFAPHQRMVGELFSLLKPHVEAHGLGEAFVSPADISFNDASTVQPDVFVVPPDQRPDVRWAVVKRLVLAAEVVSRGSEHADRWKKRLHYQRYGVGEYWIVDLDARVVERWRPDDARPEVLGARLVWRPRDDAPALDVDLVALFRRVLGPIPPAEPLVRARRRGR